MQILIVSFTFPPNKDGVSEAASAMARGLLDCGWQVSILTKCLNPPRRDLSWERASITEFDYGGSYYQPSIVMHGESHDYASFLKSCAWDAVIFHAYESALTRALPLLHDLTYYNGKEFAKHA